MTSEDIFDDILNLEEQYHQQGYEQGYADGAEAGRIEGRSVGLKSGFEKFLEAGRLQGRSIVWANRLRAPSQAVQSQENRVESQDTASPQRSLPRLAVSNSRLEKNVATLYGLVEPGTLSTENDDEAVNDFDSRLKGAQAKLKVIERAVGERTSAVESKTEPRPALTQQGQEAQQNQDIEM